MKIRFLITYDQEANGYHIALEPSNQLAIVADISNFEENYRLIFDWITSTNKQVDAKMQTEVILEKLIEAIREINQYIAERN